MRPLIQSLRTGSCFHYDAVGKTAAKYVLNLRGAELLAHLQFNAHGVVRIDLTDWAQDTDMIKLVRTFYG